MHNMMHMLQITYTPNTQSDEETYLKSKIRKPKCEKLLTQQIESNKSQLQNTNKPN